MDLIPTDPGLGVVGQSKCWNTKVLTWAKIQEELQKTHEFPGFIKVYVILTTAPRHTSVQQQMPRDGCSYERPQGKFQVRIFYWDDLQNLDFIPQEEFQRVFPRLSSLATPAQPTGPSLADYSQSLQFARMFLPTLISQEHLNWLATWDYTLGYVPAKYFDLFADLNIELDRTRHAIKDPHLRIWLNEGYRLQLSKCLPAADPIFKAIESFAQAVGGETVSVCMPDGGLAYGHAHVGTAAQIAHNWKFHAEALLAAYREVVEGTSPSY
ncbi:hypothetical protein E0E54_19635 [Azotobacter chroococcum]|uniref:hypothetical protein n=1 Tax=Azotobacter chroococcum TaxID=353 RepID=UPI00103DFCE5|nr:hypothetical protein [Azotobacter chroococcum]TBW32297.1 hypothetical protein E0E54_19635 [Azotobacter chroococcum]